MYGFLLDKCLIFPLNNETLKYCRSFSCGENDLDDFFSCDVHNYGRQLPVAKIQSYYNEQNVIWQILSAKFKCQEETQKNLPVEKLSWNCLPKNNSFVL
jgi:hypothetical protein